MVMIYVYSIQFCMAVGIHSKSELFDRKQQFCVVFCPRQNSTRSARFPNCDRKTAFTLRFAHTYTLCYLAFTKPSMQSSLRTNEKTPAPSLGQRGLLFYSAHSAGVARPITPVRSSSIHSDCATTSNFFSPPGRFARTVISTGGSC